MSRDLQLQHVTIVGVGLLGGSAGLAIRAFAPDVHIAGVGRRQSSLDAAREAGTVDSTHLDLAEVADQTELVILATPVGAFSQHLQTLKGRLRERAIVTDVGSTKADVVRIAEQVLGPGGPFVGSHPMAGSEHKGVAYARADLFQGATCIVTPTRSTPTHPAAVVEELWQRMGMKTLRMSPAAHDRATARVSHLPHAIASLLMMLPGNGDLPVAATGFRDATRLAGGDPEMWRDIFTTNRTAMLDALASFEKSLGEFGALLEADDAAGIERFLARAKTRRDETIARQWQDRRVAME